MEVNPNGQYVYVTDGSSNSINVLLFAVNQSTVALTQVGSHYSAGNDPHGVTVNAAGNCLYATNLISNEVSAFKLTKEAIMAVKNPAVAGVFVQKSNNPIPWQVLIQT
jgi:DNA-binding beta-propeller fold protein YncE